MVYGQAPFECENRLSWGVFDKQIGLVCITARVR